MLTSLLRRFHQPIYGSRLKVLVRLIAPQLREADRVLDVGCGAGALGRRVMDSPMCPRGVEVMGLEACRRGEELIPVQQYDGRRIPFPTATFDVVILADVLHHASDPHLLIDECVRVMRRALIVKDHKVQGMWAQQRLALTDWAANRPYGVQCLYRYNTSEEWKRWHDRHALEVIQEQHSMRLYPPIVNLLFGGRLQYWAVLHPNNRRRGNGMH